MVIANQSFRDVKCRSKTIFSPGLKAGDKWCLCVNRWIQAHMAVKAPMLILEATHEKTLNYTELNTLVKYAFKDE